MLEIQSRAAIGLDAGCRIGSVGEAVLYGSLEGRNGYAGDAFG